MALTLADVEKIARLSRLSLTQQEKETSLNELIRCFALAVGTQVAVTYTTPRQGDILRSVLSNEALQQWLHLTPAMTLEQGIAKTYTWYQENQ